MGAISTRCRTGSFIQRREGGEGQTSKEQHVGSSGGDLEYAVGQLEPNGNGGEGRRLQELGLAVVLGRHRTPEVGRALTCQDPTQQIC